MVDRTDRQAETRTEEERAKSWAPPAILPDPNKREGWEHRWIRVSLLGTPDPTNVSQRLREGWEPCKSEDYPEIMAQIPGTLKSRGGNLEIGGLMLCRMDHRIYKQRQDYYDRLAQQQLDGVDQNFMRENDPRMPLFRERSTKVTFGRR
jgi:hypothetical protein